MKNKKMLFIVIPIIVAITAVAIGLVIVIGGIKAKNPTTGNQGGTSSNQTSSDASSSSKSDKVSVSAAGVITVPVLVTKNPGIVAAQFDLNYDSSVFDFVDCVCGDILTEFDTSTSAGKISCLLSSSDFSSSAGDVKKTGVLVQLKLKAKDGATPGKYEITTSKASYVNFNEEFVKPDIKIDKIEIE